MNGTVMAEDPILQLLSNIKSTLPRERIVAIIQAYLAHDYADAAGRAGFYAPDCHVEDPVGTPPIVGRIALLSKFEAAVAAGARSIITPIWIKVLGDEAIAEADVRLLVNGALLVHMSATFIFAFDPLGEIARLRLFFDEASIIDAETA
jgi:steroid Delta-isomerase